ncbi:hypothetical protein D3C87_2195030 [compost metagenome]
MHTGKAGFQVRRPGTGLDNGDAGMDRSLCRFGIERMVTDAHTGYVGNGIELSRGARTNCDAKVA